MAVVSKKVLNSDPIGAQLVDFTIVTATSQAGVLFGAVTPGYRFKVTGVKVFAVTVTATISVDVQIAGTSVLSSAVTPVAGTETAGTLSSTVANLLGTASNQLQVKLTTNGSGAATNLSVMVYIRPYPMNMDGSN